jgi:carbon monoxide dehydrogenase subunit G
MLIENEFTVQAPADQVYQLMLDVERVAPCIPGTEVLGRREDGGYDAKVSMKMGPMSMGYKGSVSVAEQDDQARRAVLAAKGSEQRGQGNAQATMTMSVTDLGAGSSKVQVSSDILVTGRVAQMGRGIMQDVATRMMGAMAKCMEDALVADQAAASEAAPPPEPAAPTTSGATSDAPAAATTATTEAASAAPPPPPPASPPRPRPSPAQASPIKGGRLFLSVLANRVRSLVRRDST